MSTANILALALGLILGIIHFFSENLSPPEGERRYRVISFAAGISIAYLFLDLLPHTYQTTTHLKNFVFAFLLLGFVLIHLVEKFIYKHAKERDIAKELKEIHSLVFFGYYFLIGIVLHDKIQPNLLEGILFLVAISANPLGQNYSFPYPRAWE